MSAYDDHGESVVIFGVSGAGDGHVSEEGLEAVEGGEGCFGEGEVVEGEEFFGESAVFAVGFGVENDGGHYQRKEWGKKKERKERRKKGKNVCLSRG